MSRTSRPTKVSQNYPLAKLIEDYIRGQPDLSDRSKKIYKDCIRYYRLGLGHEPRVAHLTDKCMRRAINKLREIGRAPATIRMMFAVVKLLWRPLWEDHIINDEIRQRAPKVPKAAPVAWLPDELVKLFTAIQVMPGRIGPVRACHWWEALCSVFLDTAERRGAVLAARWCDLDEASQSITFQYNTRKGGDVCNTVRLHDNTWGYLMRIRPKTPQPNRLIFWTPYGNRHLHESFGTIIRRAKLPDDKWHKFHCLRKTAATQYAVHSTAQDRVKAASELLGHSSTVLTVETYLDKRQLVAVTEQPCDVVPRIVVPPAPAVPPKPVIPEWMMKDAREKLARERLNGLPST